MAQTQSMPAANTPAGNLAARNMLLSTGVPMCRRLGTFGPFSPGDNTIITLDRMGIFTRIVATVKATVAITAATTASAFGAYPLVSQISYRDFNNVNRVNTSGPQLFLANSVRAGRMYTGVNAQADFTQVGDIDTDIYNLPTSTDGGTINFQLDIPLAYHSGADLRGAIMAQTVVGQHQLLMSFAGDAVGNDYDNPYSAGTATISDIYVEVHEYYIQPQSLNTLPLIDLSTIYNLGGLYNDDSNIASNSSKYINYPNNQSILAAYHYFQNGGSGTLNQTDVNRVTTLANTNTNLMEFSPNRLRAQMRGMTNGDLPSGVYVLNSRSNPIATTLYGNVQSKFDLGTVTAGTNDAPTRFVSQFESFYPAGSPLPGVASGY